jgi:hypothetical protein
VTVNREALTGRWVHSHEEDTDSRLVFRPADHTFPPSRGRQAIEFRPDGAFTETVSGPDDRPAQTSGRWTLDEESHTVVLSPTREDREERTLLLESASKDRLTIDRKASSF